MSKRRESRKAGVLLASIVAVAVLATLTFVASANATTGDNPSYSYARIVRLSYVNGDVQIVRTDKSKNWEPAVMNMPVEQGFAIGTNNGRAEVEFEHGSMLWLAPNSVVQFTELALSNGGRITRMTLSEGVATFESSLSAGDTFEVTTPSMTVTPGKKAEFRVGVRNKDSAVNVLNGEVSAGTSGQTQEVAKGQMFVYEPGKKQEMAMVRSPAADAWDHWVNTRLGAEEVALNQTTLNQNAPFTYGMSDLADYGSWSFFPGYGYGWQPFGMTAGWAPFMDGQWMFYPTFGWTWVSSEPWGWVPYHFGGWQYSPAFGWMWMPGDYGTWAAAPVQWYSVGGKRIGWVPRGVNSVRPGSVAAPVVVSSKTLGKEGTNRVLSTSEISTNMQRLDAAPAENGKPWTMGAQRTSTARMAHVVVPTAANLQALRAGLATNAGAKVNVDALHEAATSRPMMGRLPEAGFTAVNGAMAAPRVPSHPPMHVTFAPMNGSYGRGYAGDSNSAFTAPNSQASAPGRVSAPVETAHPSAASPARPR
jgi:Family of unknown function (DUF6600)/FecR protein